MNQNNRATPNHGGTPSLLAGVGWAETTNTYWVTIKELPEVVAM